MMLPVLLRCIWNTLNESMLFELKERKKVVAYFFHCQHCQHSFSISSTFRVEHVDRYPLETSRDVPHNSIATETIPSEKFISRSLFARSRADVAVHVRALHVHEYLCCANTEAFSSLVVSSKECFIEPW